MSEETIYWTPWYGVPDSLLEVDARWSRQDVLAFSTSSDAGWSQFQKEYPDVCPKCKASNGLDINRKCQFCDYDNSPKKCKKCDGSYFGESHTKPLCQHCYDKAQAKKRKAEERRWAKQQKKLEEEQERERLAWRAQVALNEKNEVDIDLDLFDEYERLVPSLTIEQTEDLIEKLERTLQDAKKKKSI